MKNIIKILLLICVCITNTCGLKDSENCHHSIEFTNNSDGLLDVNFTIFSYYYPDPLDISKIPNFSEDQKNIKSNETRKNLYTRHCMEKYLNEGEWFFDTVYVYVFDATVVENTPWEVVARDYLVLKRYDLTLEDLQLLNWKISYPPTEAMRYVIQSPPFKE